LLLGLPRRQHWRQVWLQVHPSVLAVALLPALALLPLLLPCRRAVALLLAPRLPTPPWLRFHPVLQTLLLLLPALRPPQLSRLDRHQRLQLPVDLPLLWSSHLAARPPLPPAVALPQSLPLP
jgi:hypothetical protein